MTKDLEAAAPLKSKWRALIERRCAEKNERLTPDRLAAYAEMVAYDGPVSAYDLLAMLEKRQSRKIAPLTVYRHLEFLMRVGLIHHLQSAKTYLPCEHPDHLHESQFLLCTSCGSVDEVESSGVATELSQIADERGFTPSSAVVEINGLCGDCATTEIV